MTLEDALTRWTVRLALGLYVLALTLCLSRRGWKAQRLAWTLGCGAFLAHVACAFHFYHDWSHSAAYEATARRSAEVAGLGWGGGIYANYLFALIWTADVLWWWCAPASYRARPRLVYWTVQGFLAFIVFNATLVFGVGLARWGGVAACAWLVAVAVYSRRWRACRSPDPDQ